MAKLIMLRTGKLKGNGDSLFAFEDELDPACCCPTTVTTCCCPDNPISTVLKWTFGMDGTGIWAPLNGVEVTMVYIGGTECPSGSGGEYIWAAAEFPAYDCIFDQFEFVCLCSDCTDVLTSSWAHRISVAEPDPCQGDLGAPNSVTCDPFLASGTLFNSSTGDTISYTVEQA